MSPWDDPELKARLEAEVELLRLRTEARRVVDAENRPPLEWPEASTLKEILAQPPDPTVWRVDGWLPAGGRVVLAGQAKAGKTHVAANLVRCLVDGTPWLGRDAVTPVTGTVAVLDFEMTARQLYDWYGDLGIGAVDRVVVLPMRGRAGAFDLRDDGIRARWSQLLVEHDVEFVVWDCLRPVIDALGLDENHDASALLTAFDAMLRDAGQPEALVLHHMGHSGERARGDSGIIGWSDANWKLVLGEDGDEHGHRWLKANGRDVAQPEVQLAQGEDRRLSVVGGSRNAERNAAAVDAVLAVLETVPDPMTAGAIEAQLMARRIPRARAREALGQLVALNQVKVEVGERNARLHSLNTASSPVRRSSPEPAGEVASQFAAAPIGRRAGEVVGEGIEAREERRTESFSEPTPEQRELLDRLIPQHEERDAC